MKVLFGATAKKKIKNHNVQFGLSKHLFVEREANYVLSTFLIIFVYDFFFFFSVHNENNSKQQHRRNIMYMWPI